MNLFQLRSRYKCTVSDERAIYEQLGLAFRTARKRRGLLQSDVAEAIGGRTASSLSHIEAGRANPTLKTLLHLGEALGIDMALIVVPEGDQVNGLSLRIARIIHRIGPGELATLDALVSLWERQIADAGD